MHCWFLRVPRGEGDIYRTRTTGPDEDKQTEGRLLEQAFAFGSSGGAEHKLKSTVIGKRKRGSDELLFLKRLR